MESSRERFKQQYRQLGLRIAYFRKKRGLTQEQFAEQIDRSSSFVSQIEANNGKSIKGLSLETLFSIAENLEISVDSLFRE